MICPKHPSLLTVVETTRDRSVTTTDSEPNTPAGASVSTETRLRRWRHTSFPLNITSSTSGILRFSLNLTKKLILISESAAKISVLFSITNRVPSSVQTSPK